MPNTVMPTSLGRLARQLCVSLLATAWIAGSATADLISIVNPGFEDVSGQARYYNAALAETPYSRWPDR